MSCRSDRVVSADRAFAGIVFLGLFVFLWKGLEPRLLYYGFGVFGDYPLFSRDAMFLKARFGVPGGPIGILNGYLSQWFYLSWLGAAIITLVLWVLFWGLRRWLGQMGAQRGRDLAFLAPLLGVILYGRYDHPLQSLLAVGTAVWLTVLYLALPFNHTAVRLAVFTALYGIGYTLTGGTALMFALCACLAEGLVRRRPLMAGLFAVLALAVTWGLGVGVFVLEPRDAFVRGTPLDPANLVWLDERARWLMAGLYAIIPLTALGILGWRGLARVLGGRRTSNQKKRLASPSSTRPDWLARHRGGVGIGIRGAVVVCLGAVCLVSLDRGAKVQLAVHDLARQRDWPGVLGLAGQMKGRYPFTPSSIFEIDRALAHLGLMGEDLCHYPQDMRIVALFNMEDVLEQLAFSKRLELYFDLGDLNGAERCAYELLEVEGPCPRILEAMARIHIAKGQVEAARVALKALHKSPGYRAVASRWLEKLTDASRLDADPEVVSWRRWASRTDHEFRDRFDQLLLDLLQDHPDNRMAFEYLMSCYLLTHQRARLVDYLPRLKDLGYDHLPRHLAEALILLSSQTRKPIPLQGWTLDPALNEAFQQINTIMRGIQGNKQVGFGLLAPRFGDTYMFYSIFGVAGAK
jgi:hypothetical protein